jgi:hypothetical protein
MEQSFTLNQCVRLIYGETTPEESSMLLEVINGNARLKAEYENMQRGFKALGRSLLEPRRDVVGSILKYSRNTAIHLSC